MNLISIKKAILPLLFCSPCFAAYLTSNISQEQAGPNVMRHPDHFAWEVFCKITEPTKVNSTRAGWESWISAYRLFADPTQFNFGKGEATTRLRGGSAKMAAEAMKSGAHREENLALVFAKPGSDVRQEEVSINPEAAQYIIDNGLISEEGQEDLVNQGIPINFPKEAIEVKTMWIELTKQEDMSRYYCQTGRDGVVWGLQGMHITTKDIPNWFWATFEHEDNYREVNPPFPSSDTWGFKNKQPTGKLLALFKAHHIDASIWRHYRLGGAQVDYTDATGRPVVLGNNKIEGLLSGTPATQASCMTCHSRSTIGARLDFELGNDRVGAPDWRWFFGLNAQGSLVPTNVQRDFVWTLGRAKHKNQAPEGMFWQISNAKEISFVVDIAPLFKDKDIELMLKQTPSIELWNYTSVTKNIDAVYAHYAHTAKPYLPVEGKPWSKYLLDQYQAWEKDKAPYSPSK